ncbi:MAG: hypothetical protein H6739_35010 [Alphaproteobacteria bacterium]|nr:hypothetical protein [Alphaproteobacteria bacterium]
MSAEKPQVSPLRVLFVTSPLMLAMVLGVSVAVLIALSWIGGTAEGARAEITFESDCPAQWAERVQARAGAIGLGDPSLAQRGAQVSLTATLPGLEDDQTAIPALLTAPGVFAVYAAETVDSAPEGTPLATNDDIEDVFFQLDATGHPYTQVDLSPVAGQRVEAAAPPALLYVLDGQVVDTFHSELGFKGSKLELHPKLLSTKEEVRRATDWMLMLKFGPAPCEARGVGIRVVE